MVDCSRANLLMRPLWSAETGIWSFTTGSHPRLAILFQNQSGSVQGSCQGRDLLFGPV